MNPALASKTPQIGTPDVRTRIGFLVNSGPSDAAAIRTQAFAGLLGDRYESDLAYRTGGKIASIFKFFRFLRQRRIEIVYVMDMAYSGVIAAAAYKWIYRKQWIVDTGDSISALARTLGRGVIGSRLTRLLEFVSLRFSDRIVVRGTFHEQDLSKLRDGVATVQDGVDVDQFRPLNVADLRQRYGLAEVTTIGLLGSLTWSPRLQMCYGSELLETLSLLRDLPVKGVILGDGSGMPMLLARAAELGLTDRVLFLGRLPYSQLPEYLNLIDICLSTQTNDEVGRVRTTGKLPLYLACGKFVLASRVGEAALVLPESMLIDYDGVQDTGYPAKLAARIRELLERRENLRVPSVSRAIALQYFDYRRLSEKLMRVIQQL